MVQEGIVFGHHISAKGIEFDRAKIEIIEKLPSPTFMKAIRSFLGHAGFQRCFIKDFFKIMKPLCNILLKDVPFDFIDECLQAFNNLKEKLILAPIIRALDWDLPFELKCDASNYAIEAVLGQQDTNMLHIIYYASRALLDAQLDYAIIKKEFLAIVFVLENISFILNLLIDDSLH